MIVDDMVLSLIEASAAFLGCITILATIRGSPPQAGAHVV
jgi:hypothetical protein